MKEGTPIRQYLNAFNRILSDLLALEIKLEKEDKALLLLPSLPSSYGNLATTIMYGKEILELENVRQIPDQQASEEDRFCGGGIRICCQEPEGKIKE